MFYSLANDSIILQGVITITRPMWYLWNDRQSLSGFPTLYCKATT